MRKALGWALAIVTLLATSGWAQLRAFECGAKPKTITQADAQELLDQVQQRYQQVSALKANFTQQSYLAALDMIETSNGQVLFSQPGKMRWDYESPTEQVFIIQDETIWFHQPEQRQLSIDRVRRVLLADLPVSFLFGIGNLSERFKIKLACQNSAGAVLQMEPLNTAGGELQSFKLLVDPSTKLPTGGAVTTVGGNITALLLEKLQLLTQRIGSESFELDLPAGTDIIDRRLESGAIDYE